METRQIAIYVLFGIAFIVLIYIVLKLNGVITLPWWLITLPIWGGMGGALIFDWYTRNHEE